MKWTSFSFLRSFSTDIADRPKSTGVFWLQIRFNHETARRFLWWRVVIFFCVQERKVALIRHQMSFRFVGQVSVHMHKCSGVLSVATDLRAEECIELLPSFPIASAALFKMETWLSGEFVLNALVVALSSSSLFFVFLPVFGRFCSESCCWDLT